MINSLKGASTLDLDHTQKQMMHYVVRISSSSSNSCSIVPFLLIEGLYFHMIIFILLYVETGVC